MQQDYRNILIVRTDRIGDVILTLPMAQALKRLFPHARIAMLIRKYTAELVEDNPFVDHILLYDDGVRQVPFFRLAAELRSEKFDAVFHTHPLFRAALVTWLSGVRERVGTGYRWYSWLFNRRVYEHRKDARRHELEYNLNLLHAIGCSVDPSTVTPQMAVAAESLQYIRRLLDALGIASGDRVVILHPGSGSSARDWHREQFGSLAARLKMLPSIRVVITGGKGEEGIVRDVCEIAGEGVVKIADQLTLHQFAALIKSASLFVANSTGPLHIAAAVGTPVIGFYPQITPLSAARWGPYTSRKTIFTPAGKPSDCTVCLAPGQTRCACMDSISVEDVFEAAQTSLHEYQPVREHA